MSESSNTYRSCCLYFTANSLSRYINEMAEDAFKITGMAPSYGYLMLLLIDKAGLSQNELSEEMNVKASTMTRFIEKLVNKKYVTKVQDGRSALIFPTKLGMELKDPINKALAILFDMYCEKLGKEFAVKLTEDIHKANGLLK